MLNGANKDGAKKEAVPHLSLSTAVTEGAKADAVPHLSISTTRLNPLLSYTALKLLSKGTCIYQEKGETMDFLQSGGSLVLGGEFCAPQVLPCSRRE